MRQKLQVSCLREKIKWRKRSISERGALAISIPLVCLVLALGTHVFIRQQTLQTETRVEQIQDIVQESRRLLLDLLNAETGVRGYYITRQSAFLKPYYSSVAKLPKTWARLEQLGRNHPRQVEYTKAIEQLSRQKLNLLAEGIARSPSAASRNFSGDTQAQLLRGNQIMDRLRNELATFEAEQDRQLNASYQDLQRLRDLNISAIVLGVIISGIGAAIAAGLFKNLTRELQERELRLQGTNNLLRAIFRNVVDGVFALDASGKIEECNDAAIAMFGYERAQLIGRELTMLLGDQGQHPTSLPTPTKVEVGEVGKLWQTIGQHHSGNHFPLELSISNIDFDERQIAIVRDITLRQQAEAKLQSRAEELAALNLTLLSTNTKLKERNRELDRFTYVTSHDLKAPLRAIANLSSWIAEDLGEGLPPENQQQLILLRGRVDRMEALINGLLEYSRIGRRPVLTEFTDVEQLIAEIVTALAPPSTFTIDVAADLPKFHTRRILLKQVLLALIENAIEHHPSDRGKVKIRVTDGGDRYDFAVADDGQGIEPQYHERIYHIFQTLQPRDTHESTGVGLAIVKKIVETEGGAMRLQSSLGQGATFYFSWPKYPLESTYVEGE